MQLKRFSTQELRKICKELFYDYASTMDDNGKTPMDECHEEYVSRLKQYEDRIQLYEQKLAAKCLDEDARKSLTKQLYYLQGSAGLIKNSSLKSQKELYAKTKKMDFACTTLRIPLDKKINSYYDDFTLEVVFHDDVATLKGKYDDYKKLKTQEEKRKFIEENTQITHFGLLFLKNNRLVSIIALQGELNTEDVRVIESDVVLLPIKFSDFSTLTLKDISKIQNNDLKQFIQSKIDLDKENMKELSSQLIRGDVYSIYESKINNSPDLYIRYTCRGTGRVYYNLLNLHNLSLSKYFKQNDYDSYCKAWWDLNTLGGNPNNEKPVIRC